MKPRIEHIPEEEWGKWNNKSTREHTWGKTPSEHTRIAKEEPEIETWRYQDYEEQDIDRELRNRANRKAHGNDGIPGAAYKETRQWAIKP